MRSAPMMTLIGLLALGLAAPAAAQDRFGLGIPGLGGPGGFPAAQGRDLPWGIGPDWGAPAPSGWPGREMPAWPAPGASPWPAPGMSAWPTPDPFGGYPASRPQPPGVPGGPFGGQFGSAQLVGLAEQLAAQADAFLAAFSLDARKVPQGAEFLADATALRNAALRFRQAAAGGAPPGLLVAEYRTVAATWQQLEGRMAFVNRGRIGPNIATALQMGQTVDQMGRLLP